MLRVEALEKREPRSGMGMDGVGGLRLEPRRGASSDEALGTTRVVALEMV